MARLTKDKALDHLGHSGVHELTNALRAGTPYKSIITAMAAFGARVPGSTPDAQAAWISAFNVDVLHTRRQHRLPRKGRIIKSLTKFQVNEEIMSSNLSERVKEALVRLIYGGDLNGE
jgi:hypothetical protein